MTKEIPILFSSEMVEAIWNGTKTQTRRILKPMPSQREWLSERALSNASDNCEIFNHQKTSDLWVQLYFKDSDNPKSPLTCVKSPYQVDDALWVREKFYAYGKWIKDGLSSKGKQKWRFKDLTKPDFEYQYFDNPPQKIEKGRGEIGWYGRSSLFMPKVACRIKLKIKNVRCERLQSIGESDAFKEGVKYCQFGENFQGQYQYNGYMDYIDEMGVDNIFDSPFDSFKSLWRSIHKNDSWDKNPFVWVIEFERIA